MDELALRQANGGDDEEAALRRALALSEAVEGRFWPANLMSRGRRLD